MFKDSNLLSLIAANLIAIMLVLVFQQDIISVLWLYWWQSITFCLISFIRILRFKRFSAKGINPPMEDNSNTTRNTLLLFFMFVYGFVHLVYAMFIGFAFGLFLEHKPIDRLFILIGIVIFVLYQTKELLFTKQSDDIPLIGTEFLKPFKRLIPMHLTIIAGPWLFLTGVVSKQENLSFTLVLIFQSILMIMDVFGYLNQQKKFFFLREKEDGDTTKINLGIKIKKR